MMGVTKDEQKFLDKAAANYTCLLWASEKSGTWEFLTTAAWSLARFALAERRKDQFCDVAENVEPTNEARVFQGELVDRLAETFRVAYHDNESSVREGIRAVLSELAKAPVELPSVRAIEAAIVDAYERKQYDAEESAVNVRRALEALVAPVLAAKDATNAAVKASDLEKLETIEMQRNRIVELEKRAADMQAANANCQLAIDALEKDREFWKSESK